MSGLSHLDELEAEAIYIIREVAAECEKPVMLTKKVFICLFREYPVLTGLSEVFRDR